MDVSSLCCDSLYWVHHRHHPPLAVRPRVVVASPRPRGESLRPRDDVRGVVVVVPYFDHLLLRILCSLQSRQRAVGAYPLLLVLIDLNEIAQRVIRVDGRLHRRARRAEIV